MECERARLNLLDGQADEHLERCEACRSFAADAQSVLRLLHSNEPMPTRLRQRLVAKSRASAVLRFVRIATVAACLAVIFLLPLAHREATSPPTPLVSHAREELETITEEIDRIEFSVDLNRLEQEVR